MGEQLKLPLEEWLTPAEVWERFERFQNVQRTLAMLSELAEREDEA